MDEVENESYVGGYVDDVEENDDFSILTYNSDIIPELVPHIIKYVPSRLAHHYVPPPGLFDNNSSSGSKCTKSPTCLIEVGPVRVQPMLEAKRKWLTPSYSKEYEQDYLTKDESDKDFVFKGNEDYSIIDEAVVIYKLQKRGLAHKYTLLFITK